MNFALMHHHKYSLVELENMIPFERDIIIHYILESLEDEKNRHAE